MTQPPLPKTTHYHKISYYHQKQDTKREREGILSKNEEPHFQTLISGVCNRALCERCIDFFVTTAFSPCVGFFFRLD